MGWILNSKVGLACSVVAAVAAAAAGNLLVAVTARVHEAAKLRVPPGWEWVEQIVGYVWLVLFACMGAASWLAYRTRGTNARRDGRIIVGLLIVCLLYPVYTLGMQAVPGLVANVAVLCLTVAVVAGVSHSSWAAAGLVSPVAVWIALATVYMVKLVSLNLTS